MYGSMHGSLGASNSLNPVKQMSISLPDGTQLSERIEVAPYDTLSELVRRAAEVAMRTIRRKLDPGTLRIATRAA